MLGAGQSPTPSVHTIILKDDRPSRQTRERAGPLRHLSRSRNPLVWIASLSLAMTKGAVVS